MKRFVRQNSLTLFFLVIFLVTVAAQSQAGWRLYRDDQHTHHEQRGKVGGLTRPDGEQRCEHGAQKR